MTPLVPRRFYTENIKKWELEGHIFKDFSREHVDLSHLPEFYSEGYETSHRTIEKNYLLNFLLINKIAYCYEDNGHLIFEICHNFEELVS